MNERIKHMAIQAGFDLDVHDSNDGNFYGYDGRWINQDITRLVDAVVRDICNSLYLEAMRYDAMPRGSYDFSSNYMYSEGQAASAALKVVANRVSNQFGLL
jgi:hypothetical protein